MSKRWSADGEIFLRRWLARKMAIACTACSPSRRLQDGLDRLVAGVQAGQRCSGSTSTRLGRQDIAQSAPGRACTKSGQRPVVRTRLGARRTVASTAAVGTARWSAGMGNLARAALRTGAAGRSQHGRHGEGLGRLRAERLGLGRDAGGGHGRLRDALARRLGASEEGKCWAGLAGRIRRQAEGRKWSVACGSIASRTGLAKWAKPKGNPFQLFHCFPILQTWKYQTPSY
jgi:hypothetical protein